MSVITRDTFQSAKPAWIATEENMMFFMCQKEEKKRRTHQLWKTDISNPA